MRHQNQDYSRGRNNEISQHSFTLIKGTVESSRKQVYNRVDGIKSTIEIAQDMGVPLHKVSGRFSELKAQNKIIQISTKKIGNSHFGVYKKV